MALVQYDEKLQYAEISENGRMGWQNIPMIFQNA